MPSMDALDGCPRWMFSMNAFVQTETLVPAYPTAPERGIRELRSIVGRLGAGASHGHHVQPRRVSVARFPAYPEDLPLSFVDKGRCSIENLLAIEFQVVAQRSILFSNSATKLGD